MKGDTDAKSIGKRVILPASYTGSPRYMAEKYHDAMAICRWYGNPDLFITMTTNPKWVELSNHLQLYGTDDPNDRPDLECRVFKMKLDELMSDFNWLDDNATISNKQLCSVGDLNMFLSSTTTQVSNRLPTDFLSFPLKIIISNGPSLTG